MCRQIVERPVRLCVPILLALLALAPGAAADAKGSSSFQDHEIAHDAPTEVPMTVHLGCDLVLTTGGGTATVTMDHLPPWLAATTATVEADPAACIPGVQGNVSKDVTIKVTPSPDAPGLVLADLNATVSYTGELRGNATAAIEVPPVVVKYRPGHRITPEGDQTFQVPLGTDPFSFDMVIDVTANARTMVMFEDKKVSDPDALLNGLKAQTYDVAAGQREETRKVVFTPPADASWQRVTVTFRTFSHCLDGPHCGEQMQRNVTWTFVNQASAMDGGDDKEAPSGWLAPLVALVVAAVAVRRRA